MNLMQMHFQREKHSTPVMEMRDWQNPTVIQLADDMYAHCRNDFWIEEH